MLKDEFQYGIGECMGNLLNTYRDIASAVKYANIPVPRIDSNHRLKTDGWERIKPALRASSFFQPSDLSDG